MVVIERFRGRMDAVGVSQSELARRLGLSQGTIAKLANGTSTGSKHLHSIARALETTPAYLTGEADDPSEGALPAPTATMIADQIDAVMIPFYNAPHSMGAGSLFDTEASHELVPLAKSWLRGKVSGGLDQLMLLPGQGDSMEPTIRDGDVVLVDKAQTVVNQPDRIWAFNHLESGYIKRLRRARLGEFTVSSDNKAVSEWPASIDDITIVGRVVSIMRWQ